MREMDRLLTSCTPVPTHAQLRTVARPNRHPHHKPTMGGKNSANPTITQAKHVSVTPHTHTRARTNKVQYPTQTNQEGQTFCCLAAILVHRNTCDRRRHCLSFLLISMLARRATLKVAGTFVGPNDGALFDSHIRLFDFFFFFLSWVALVSHTLHPFALPLTPGVVHPGVLTRPMVDSCRSGLRTFSVSWKLEPKGPSVKTAIPGPKSLALAAQMNHLQDARAAHFFSDMKHSIGNYVQDADGNVLLDVFCQISSIALGYNHPALIKLAKSDLMAQVLMNRPALGVMPIQEWPQLVEDSFMRVKPKGLTQVFTMMCGTCANEGAFKASFMYWMERERKGSGIATFTPEELQSCMKNQQPGSPHLSVLSFTGAFHGRALGALSATRSKALHKIDMPAFDWPVAPFPQLKYPLKDHVQENAAEEARCLAELDSILTAWRKSKPVAAIIVEPIQVHTPVLHRQHACI